MEKQQNSELSAADAEFVELVSSISMGSRLAIEEGFIQHGDTTCLKHSVAVAYFSYRAAIHYGWIGVPSVRARPRGDTS